MLGKKAMVVVLFGILVAGVPGPGAVASPSVAAGTSPSDEDGSPDSQDTTGPTFGGGGCDGTTPPGRNCQNGMQGEGRSTTRSVQVLSRQGTWSIFLALLGLD